MTSAGPAIELPVRPEEERPRRRSGRHLRPVEKQKRRRSPAVPIVVGAGIVVVALFALAAMHALLINRQIRLDDLRQDAAAEAEEVRRLRLEVAELEAPDRVLDVARTRLGMVDPAEVGYLLPAGVEGGDGEPIRVAPATPAPPPDSTADDATGAGAPDQGLDSSSGTVSPEYQEVQETLGTGQGPSPGTGDPGHPDDPGAAGGTQTDPPAQSGDDASGVAEGGPEESAE
ncbi:MAG: septum formation initiator family protein [Acidimicrobiales bacterium]|nr:septum formation initiator family protein [Acidimicrobiales bacterium]